MMMLQKYVMEALEVLLQNNKKEKSECCLLYTSDAADELDGVDLGGRRIIKKKKTALMR